MSHTNLPVGHVGSEAVFEASRKPERAKAADEEANLQRGHWDQTTSYGLLLHVMAHIYLGHLGGEEWGVKGAR